MRSGVKRCVNAPARYQRRISEVCDMNGTTPLGDSHYPAGLRMLMTVDAVGGVWRYSMDLAKGLRDAGVDLVFLGFGPQPSPAQRREARGLGILEWADAPLDWMLGDEASLAHVPALLTATIARHAIEIAHLNQPSQAVGLDVDIPIITVSHACALSWFAAVEGTGVPRQWEWQARRNTAGFARADATIAPSRSQAALLESCYGPIRGVYVVHHASRAPEQRTRDEPFVLAAARWWDKAKNGALLDEAARDMIWPVHMAGAMRGPTGDALELQNATALGELPYDAMLAQMGRAGIFVSSSLYQPFGLAVVEAARAGLPLVLSDIPTYRELWDGVAFFFRPDDPGALAQLVNRLGASAELRAEFGAAARLRAARFSAQAQTAAMLRIYADVRRNRPAFAAVG